MLPTLWMLLSSLMLAPEASDTLPLFASDEPLELALVADFGSLGRDRAQDPEDRPALLALADGDTLEVGLRPRGHFRRDPRYCSFPPLRLDLKREDARGTVFEGQDKLKLVVPCRPERPGYEELVLREYLLYRVWGLVSDVALRVRLARIRFVEASDPSDASARWAFLIESDDELAARVGGEAVDIPEGKGVPPAYLHPFASTRLAVFQYMIGNTDWSDSGAHNVLILAVGSRIVPVPYDFDFAGAVEAPYAAPAEGLPIRSVRQRLYRGWCRPGLDTEDILQRFRDARPAIESLYRSFTPLPEQVREETLAYYSQFFDYVATSEMAERRLFRDCMPIR
jgi:hypothetical protein